MPTAVSLFTGCGGSDAGLVEAGFDVLFANDILPYAKEVYAANLRETDYSLRDITEITKFPKCDLLVGCYPCQGFSGGGLRDPENNLNFLYREFDRALRKIKPKAFIVENVSGMTRADFFHLFENQIRRFRLAGYNVSAKVLNAQDYGVPQDRARLFFVGIKSRFGIRYEFPTPTHVKKMVAETHHQICPSIRDAIGDLPLWPEGEYDTQPFHWYYLSRNRYRGWDGVSKTIVANSRHVPLHPISPKLLRISTDKWVFEEKGPARRLSFREAARLQGFKRDMCFPDTAGLRMKYKVVGNAVPPPVFREVARSLPNIW
jgi:DNA (cytosine-5)-methyltransferase 1